MGLVVREWPEGWSVESIRFHGPDTVSCEIVSVGQRTPLIGVYLPPSTLDHITDLEEALKRLPGR